MSPTLFEFRPWEQPINPPKHQGNLPFNVKNLKSHFRKRHKVLLNIHAPQTHHFLSRPWHSSCCAHKAEKVNIPTSGKIITNPKRQLAHLLPRVQKPKQGRKKKTKNTRVECEKASAIWIRIAILSQNSVETPLNSEKYFSLSEKNVRTWICWDFSFNQVLFLKIE